MNEYKHNRLCIFLAEITNYNDDLLSSLDEMSVMLAELNEMLDEGNVEGLKDWWNKVVKFSKAVWSHISSAAKSIYNLVVNGGKSAVDTCKKHKDACKELAKEGLKAASSALKTADAS